MGEVSSPNCLPSTGHFPNAAARGTPAPRGGHLPQMQPWTMRVRTLVPGDILSLCPDPAPMAPPAALGWPHVQPAVILGHRKKSKPFFLSSRNVLLRHK